MNHHIIYTHHNVANSLVEIKKQDFSPNWWADIGLFFRKRGKIPPCKQCERAANSPSPVQTRF